MLQTHHPRGARDPLLIVAPHPDDEVVGAGGLLALELAAGRTVAVVVVTDGAGAPQAAPRLTPAELVERRRQECRAGLAELGECEVTFLSSPSASLREPAGRKRAADGIAAALLELAPADVFVTAPFEEHMTHRLVTRATVEAIRLLPSPGGMRLWGYPVWGELWGEEGVVRVDIESVVVSKRRAIAAHVSQVTARAYDEGTLAGNRHDAIFSDTHGLDDAGHVERFLDMSALVAHPDLDVADFARSRARAELDRLYPSE